jgi:hypothetical protein
MIFVMKFQAAAMSRSSVPEDDRVDFCLYVDEFQNFSTDSFATIMSEARKYHLNLIVANQFTTQLTEEIRDAVFGNIGTIVSFRIGQNDVEALGRYFQPTFDADDLLRIPNANTVVRTLVGGVPTQPFSMATLPPLGTPNQKLADALKQLSAAKYGKPRAVVEKAIFERMATKAPAPNAPQGPAAPSGQAPAVAGFGGGAAAPPPVPAQPPMSPPGSFLDEWLAKQRAATPLTPSWQSAPAGPPLPAMRQHQHGGGGTSKEPPDESQATGNISSGQLDQAEVDGVAQELKKGLQDPPVSTGSGPNQSEGVLHIQSTKPGDSGRDDTIAIDNEGKLHLREPAVGVTPKE